MLQLQVKQATEDREVLDGQLPRGGGPIAARLAAAEKDLASLEGCCRWRRAAAPARQDAAAAGTVPQAQRELPRRGGAGGEVLLQVGLAAKIRAQAV